MSEKRYKPKKGVIVVVPTIPECNFCPEPTPGPYDFATMMGPWANGCEKHWKMYRAAPMLGVGKGQLWITQDQVADPMESPMKQNVLGIAARYNDAETEEHGFQAFVASQGLKMEDVLYIAEQRALRVLWMELGRDMSFFKGSEPKGISLSPAERKRLNILQATILDGIFIGWRAARLQAEE